MNSLWLVLHLLDRPQIRRGLDPTVFISIGDNCELRSTPLPSSEVQAWMPIHMQYQNVVVGVDGVASWWLGGWSDIGGRRCRRRTVDNVSLSVSFRLVGVCIYS